MSSMNNNQGHSIWLNFLPLGMFVHSVWCCVQCLMLYTVYGAVYSDAMYSVWWTVQCLMLYAMYDAVYSV